MMMKKRQVERVYLRRPAGILFLPVSSSSSSRCDDDYAYDDYAYDDYAYDDYAYDDYADDDCADDDYDDGDSDWNRVSVKACRNLIPIGISIIIRRNERRRNAE